MYAKSNIKAIEMQGAWGKEEALRIVLERGDGTVIHTAVVYRPPTQIEEIDNKLIIDIAKIATKGEVIILGDFNLPDVDWSTPSANLARSKKIVDAFQDALLRQMVM